MRPKPLALIIDNERAARRLLRLALEQERYKLIEAENGRAGLSAAVEKQPDIIILDLELPDMDGLRVLQHLREWCWKPALVLSQRTRVTDKVSALDAGANDYLTKLFEPIELLARLRVLQRSVPGIPDGPLLIEGDLKVNLVTQEITLRGQPLCLTPTEQVLFYLLARYAGKVVTCRHLLRSIWGADAEDKTHDLRVYVAQLRKKLGADGEIMIRSEGSIGYCLALGSERKHNGLAVVS